MSTYPKDTSPNHSAPRRGRPKGDREAKRAELLRAVIAVIAREGYAGASMRKVSQQAGCTTGAVTYYFANKEEMIIAVAESLFDQFDQILDGDDEQQDVHALLHHWLDWSNISDTDTWLAIFQLLVHARHEPAFASIVRERYAALRSALAAVLERGQKEGSIRRDIPARVLSDQLCAMTDGWMMLMPIEPERFESPHGHTLITSALALIAPPSEQR